MSFKGRDCIKYSYGRSVTYTCNPLGSVICRSVHLRYNVCIHTVEDLPGAQSMMKGLIVIEQSINQWIVIFEWMVTGRTVLIAKSENTKEPRQYRPIACLNTMYKTLTEEKYRYHLCTYSLELLYSCSHAGWENLMLQDI